MAKRFIDTDIWDKEWFMDLDFKLKCLVQLVRSKCDIAGIWSPNWRMAKMYLGEDVNEHELLKIDGGRQFKKLKNGKIFCIDFIKFQYGVLSEKSPVHKKIFSILSENSIDYLGNEIGYVYPINRVQEEEEDKEEEKEKEEGGVGETFFSQNLLITEMKKTFINNFPEAFIDENDLPALLEIAKKIFKWLNLQGNFLAHKEQIVENFETIITHCKADSFLQRYSISQINKNFSSVIQSLKSNAGATKDTGTKLGTSDARIDAIAKW